MAGSWRIDAGSKHCKSVSNRASVGVVNLRVIASTLRLRRPRHVFMALTRQATRSSYQAFYAGMTVTGNDQTERRQSCLRKGRDVAH
jgi:hypothetical protein